MQGFAVHLFGILFGIQVGVDHDFSAVVLAQNAGIQAEVVVLGHTPGAAGVVLIVHTAALVLFGQTLLGALLGFAVQSDDPVSLGCGIGMDKDMEDIGTVLQYVVSVTANDDTGTLLSQLQDHVALDVPQEVGCGKAVHDTGDALGGKSISQSAGCRSVLTVLFDKFGSETGLQSHLLHQLKLIVKMNTTK